MPLPANATLSIRSPEVPPPARPAPTNTAVISAGETGGSSHTTFVPSNIMAWPEEAPAGLILAVVTAWSASLVVITEPLEMVGFG